MIQSIEALRDAILALENDSEGYVYLRGAAALYCWKEPPPGWFYTAFLIVCAEDGELKRYLKAVSEATGMGGSATLEAVMEQVFEVYRSQLTEGGYTSGNAE